MTVRNNRMGNSVKSPTKVLRTIPFFYPYVTGPAKQAYHISRGLEAAGIASPVITTHQTTELKITKRRNCSVLAKG